MATRTNERRNRITRPAEGTSARMVWDFCDAFYAKTSVLPNPATIQAFAEKMNLSASTSKAARINWLRFHGYPLLRRGRQVEGMEVSSQLDLFYDRD